MPQVGFEPISQVFQQAKTVHVLDREATGIGIFNGLHSVLSQKIEFFITTAVRTLNPTATELVTRIMSLDNYKISLKMRHVQLYTLYSSLNYKIFIKCKNFTKKLI
jgi:hypothetical protein